MEASDALVLALSVDRRPGAPQTTLNCAAALAAGHKIITYLAANAEAIWANEGHRAKITTLAKWAIIFATVGQSTKAQAGGVPQLKAYGIASTTFLVPNGYNPSNTVRDTFKTWYAHCNTLRTRDPALTDVYSLGNSPMWLAYYSRAKAATSDGQTHYIPFSGNFGAIPRADGKVFTKRVVGDQHVLDYQYAQPERQVWMRSYLTSLNMRPADFIAHPGVLMELVLSGQGLISFLSFMEAWAGDRAGEFQTSLRLALFRSSSVMVWSDIDTPPDLAQYVKAKEEGLSTEAAKTALIAAHAGNRGDVPLERYNIAKAVHDDYMDGPQANMDALEAWFTAHHYVFAFHDFADEAEFDIWSNLMKESRYYLGFKFEPDVWGQDDAEIPPVISPKLMADEAWKVAKFADTWAAQ